MIFIHLNTNKFLYNSQPWCGNGITSVCHWLSSKTISVLLSTYFTLIKGSSGSPNRPTVSYGKKYLKSFFVKV